LILKCEKIWRKKHAIFEKRMDPRGQNTEKNLTQTLREFFTKSSLTIT